MLDGSADGHDDDRGHPVRGALEPRRPRGARRATSWSSRRPGVARSRPLRCGSTARWSRSSSIGSSSSAVGGDLRPTRGPTAPARVASVPPSMPPPRSGVNRPRREPKADDAKRPVLDPAPRRSCVAFPPPTADRRPHTRRSHGHVHPRAHAGRRASSAPRSTADATSCAWRRPPRRPVSRQGRSPTTTTRGCPSMGTARSSGRSSAASRRDGGCGGVETEGLRESNPRPAQPPRTLTAAVQPPQKRAHSTALLPSTSSPLVSCTEPAHVSVSAAMIRPRTHCGRLARRSRRCLGRSTARSPAARAPRP